MRRVVPDRILSVRVLPLVVRTGVAAGNKLGNVGCWDVDGGAVAGADGVFEYLPHRGPVGAIVSHPATPQKVMFFSLFYSCRRAMHMFLRVTEYFLVCKLVYLK